LSNPKEKAATTRKVALAAILSAAAVVLSPVVTFPLPLATPFPVQHMVNAIAGVLLGPWYAVMVAVVVGSVRYMLGTGTIHAFPGGIFGGLVVGLAYRYLLKKDSNILFPHTKSEIRISKSETPACRQAGIQMLKCSNDQNARKFFIVALHSF